MQFAVQRRVCAGGNLPHLAGDLHAGLARERHRVVCLGQRAREHALHGAVAVAQGHEHDVLLLALAVDAPEDADAGAAATVRAGVVHVFVLVTGGGCAGGFAVAGAEADGVGVLFVEFDLYGFGEGGVLGDLDVFGFF